MDAIWGGLLKFWENTEQNANIQTFVRYRIERAAKKKFFLFLSKKVDKKTLASFPKKEKKNLRNIVLVLSKWPQSIIDYTIKNMGIF